MTNGVDLGLQASPAWRDPILDDGNAHRKSW